MRFITIIVALAILAPASRAAEITVNLDRCVVLNSNNDRTAESRVALHFDLPPELVGKEVIFAELYFELPIQPLRSDSLFELRFASFSAEWWENTIDYDNSIEIADSIGVGCHTAVLGINNLFQIDLTDYLMAIVEGNRLNYGLLASADLLGDLNIRLQDNLGPVIRQAARVRIVYR